MNGEKGLTEFGGQKDHPLISGNAGAQAEQKPDGKWRAVAVP